jgi:hypothetical protein
MRNSFTYRSQEPVYCNLLDSEAACILNENVRVNRNLAIGHATRECEGS